MLTKRKYAVNSIGINLFYEIYLKINFLEKSSAHDCIKEILKRIINIK
jgi:hypothetical protein